MSIFILLLPFSFHIPNIFRLNYIYQWMPCGIGYVAVLSETKFGSSAHTRIAVDVILNLFVQIFIPYALVIVANAVLIVTLLKALKNRSKLTGKY